MTSQEETCSVCLFFSSVQSNKLALILRLLWCDRLSGAGEAEVNETCSVPLTSFQASRQFRSVFSEHFTALFKSLSLFFKIFLRDLHGGPVVKTLLPMQGAWVRSLVRELRSHSVAYTHTHTHTHIYIHTHTHTHIYIFIDISLYIYCMCVYTYTSFFEMEM